MSAASLFTEGTVLSCFQLALPVGHLASVWNTIRSASQTVARTQTRQGQQHVTASVTADDFPVNQHELTNGVRETMVFPLYRRILPYSNNTLRQTASAF